MSTGYGYYEPSYHGLFLRRVDLLEDWDGNLLWNRACTSMMRLRDAGSMTPKIYFGSSSGVQAMRVLAFVLQRTRLIKPTTSAGKTLTTSPGVLKLE